jgi:hypothetical protein
LFALRFSQIWILDVIEESRDYLDPYYILVMCKKLWSEFQPFFSLAQFFQKYFLPQRSTFFYLVVKFRTCGHLWQNFQIFLCWWSSNFECINRNLGFKMLKSTISIRLCDNEINIRIINLWKSNQLLWNMIKICEQQLLIGMR